MELKICELFMNCSLETVHKSTLYVSGVVEEIFKIGSMAPGAMLYDAYKEFQVIIGNIFCETNSSLVQIQYN